jgi:hypothetical protein
LAFSDWPTILPNATSAVALDSLARVLERLGLERKAKEGGDVAATLAAFYRQPPLPATVAEPSPAAARADEPPGEEPVNAA